MKCRGSVGGAGFQGSPYYGYAGYQSDCYEEFFRLQQSCPSVGLFVGPLVGNPSERDHTLATTERRKRAYCYVYSCFIVVVFMQLIVIIVTRIDYTCYCHC